MAIGVLGDDDDLHCLTSKKAWPAPEPAWKFSGSHQRQCFSWMMPGHRLRCAVDTMPTP